jgi:tetratricopeptide (TPR) repeat protein
MAVSRERVVQNAEKYVSRGKVDSAIKEYRKLLAENPNDISTLNRVGDLYARINRNSEAIDLFTQIAEQYAEDGFFVKSIAIYKKIIKLDPTLLEVYEQLADLYHRQGLVNEARTQYQVLADYYLKHDRTSQAIGIYRRMAELEPDDPSHHVKLAELYQEGGQVEEAMGEYRAIAALMLQHDRGNEAARVFARALDVDSGDIGFIADAVLKLKEGGHVAAAAHFLSLAVERNPKAEKVARIAGISEREEPAPAVAEAGGEAAAEPEVEPAFEPELAATADQTEEDEADTAEVPWQQLQEPAFSEVAEDDSVTAPPEPPGTDLAPMAAAEPEMGELDAAGFELDLDDDMPESLVQPPADMLEDTGRRGAAWGDVEISAAPETPAPAPEVAGRAAEESVTGTFEFELDLDADGAELLEAAGRPGLEPIDEAHADLDHELLERTAAEVLPESTHDSEDLLTEAEVLARYGIEEKALERLAELLHREPDNLPGYRLMVGIHLDAGRHSRAAAVAGQMAEVAERLEDEEIWPELCQRLEAAGYVVEPGYVQPPAGEVEAHVEEAAPAADEVEFAIEDAEPAAPEEEAEPEAVEIAAEDEAPAPEEIELRLDDGAFELPEIELDAEPHPEVEPGPAEDVPPVSVRQKRRERADVESALADLAGRFLRPRSKKEPARPEAAAEAAPAPAETPPLAAETPPVAGGAVDPLRALGDSLRAEIDAGVADEEPAAEEASPSDLDDTGMSWLDEVAAAPEQPPAFTDEADFFDLGAELEQELSAEEDLGPDELVMGPSEQSLEEIVEGFKRGVAENLSPEDYDTHFNLGIAYREMGLLDEAIGEFQVAAREPSYLVSCSSMLGLCFREKGLPELAVKWYRRGLDAPGLAEDDRAGLLYDLGEAQAAAGDRMAAYHTFVDLYGIDTSYRDVVARLAELEPVR